jgi:mono/diheme cytochrome c family protein
LAAASVAETFFRTKVFQPLSGECSSCHATAGAQAPKFLDASAEVSYQGVDAFGFITSNSRLLSKGTHASGAGRALSSATRALVEDWLELEKSERGNKSSQGVLEKLGACMDRNQYLGIGLQTLKTVPRPGENTNRCTGCNQTGCSSCHGDVRTPFYMQIGSALGDDTFEKNQLAPFIYMMFTVNGSEPAPSHRIEAKQKQVNAMSAYGGHPNFVLPPDVVQRLDAFVDRTIAKYKAGTCPPAASTPPAQTPSPSP